MNWQSSAMRALARLAAAWRTQPRHVVLAVQALIVLLPLIFVLLPQLESSLTLAHRYALDKESEWEGTNNSLESARCLRKTGLWLMYCDGSPFSAEDPGQVLLLSLWGKIVGRDPTLVDVARMNLIINTIGLLVLTLTLLRLGMFATAVFLLVFGPLVYLGWFDTLPHWALIGAASMQLVLPMALIGHTKRWLSPGQSVAAMAIGLLLLAFATLLRESVGSMTVIVTLCVAIWSLWYGPRDWRRVLGIVAVVAATVVAAQSSRPIVAARNAAYALDTAHLPPTHGMSHTLYIGLGAVENKFGIKYEDAAGRDAAAAAVPGIVMYSTDYFRVMGELYLRKWREEPLEVMRIYLVKLWTQITDSILAETPPLVVVLAGAIAIQLLAGHRRWRAGDRGADTRLAINLVILAFIGLFIVQGTLATPTRLYAMPIGPFILVLIGVAIENLAAWLWRIAPATTRLALRGDCSS